MSYEELIEKIRECFLQADVSGINGHLAYQFNITGEAEGAFYVEVSDGVLSIEPYEYFDRDVLFTTTAQTLLDIVNGNQDAVKAFLEGKLKVEGDFDKALKLQEFSGKPKQSVVSKILSKKK
ncbi:MAG: SCP2 sterol-binding domain-containing protein [Lachnospiraceae bacterium]